jgi:hypothetical protein
MEITSKSLKYKCGHRALTQILSGRENIAIQHASKTRCLKCFNSKSLEPEINIAVGATVWVSCKAFGILFEMDLIECTVIKLIASSNQVVVTIIDGNFQNVLINTQSIEYTISTKYIWLKP